MASQRLIPQLVELLSPSHPEGVHHVACELLKVVITISSPSQGQTGLSEGLQNHSLASNLFARELASPDCVSQLSSYILLAGDLHNSTEQRPSSASAKIDSPASQTSLENAAASSVGYSISVIIDLIRKNNSDYLEPYLFHTLRNRLIQVQQQSYSTASEVEASREVLEIAMTEMTEKMGVVHFGVLMQRMSRSLPLLRRLLERPRTGVSVSTDWASYI